MESISICLRKLIKNSIWVAFIFVVTANASIAATAIFAGGCFWCMEPPFDKVNGVQKTEAGYTGGVVKNPTYKQVTYENTGHYEAVRITYDPQVVSYEQLLKIYWRNVDPTDAGGQFCDRGNSYKAAIFTLNQKQMQLAVKSKQQLQQSKRFKNIVTEILPAKAFYVAEGYHQDYYKKNPYRYKYYRYRCGRDQRLDQLWRK
jgi:peptide-methionine (S)-S-oxide reductase